MVLSEARRKSLAHAATTGKLSRRQLLRRAAALGLSAPVIAGLLAACGGGGGNNNGSSSTSTSGGPAGSPAGSGPANAPAGTPKAASPVGQSSGGRRGEGGLLKLLWWQAPTILNSHFAQGTKDFDAARVVLEPLADFDKDGNMVPILAAEIPSRENNGVAQDGKSVTWKLKEGVKWSDGEPFTSADVKFTFDFITNKDAATTTAGYYDIVVSVDTPDDLTATIHFNKPSPNWYSVFCGVYGMILPEHALRDFTGSKARNAPFNLKPIGTGPFKVDNFKPGDQANYSVNDNYRDPNRPFFATINLKGGGDPTSAARAAIQTGEVDYAWNLQVTGQVLKSLEQGGTGQLVIYPGSGLERLLINVTDPNKEVDGERSHLGTPHPFQADMNVRKAYNLAIPRDVLATQLYGPGGTASANVLVAPPRYVSKNTSWKYDLQAAGALLDQAGWAMGSDNVRAKGGVRMQVTYQTTVNTLRQQEQEIVKNALGQLGLNVTLKTVDSSVFFSSDAGNPDTAAHFYTDLEMFTNSPGSPYPLDYMIGWYGAPDNIAQKANQWSGNNYERWQNKDYDAAFEQAQTELDPDKQAELFIKMNDLVVNNYVDVPEVARNGVSGAAKNLQNLDLSPWTSELWNLANWTRG